MSRCCPGCSKVASSEPGRGGSDRSSTHGKMPGSVGAYPNLETHGNSSCTMRAHTSAIIDPPAMRLRNRQRKWTARVASRVRDPCNDKLRGSLDDHRLTRLATSSRSSVATSISASINSTLRALMWRPLRCFLPISLAHDSTLSDCRQLSKLCCVASMGSVRRGASGTTCRNTSTLDAERPRTHTQTCIGPRPSPPIVPLCFSSKGSPIFGGGQGAPSPYGYCMVMVIYSALVRSHQSTLHHPPSTPMHPPLPHMSLDARCTAALYNTSPPGLSTPYSPSRSGSRQRMSPSAVAAKTSPDGA